jgi:hypothetical protein
MIKDVITWLYVRASFNACAFSLINLFILFHYLPPTVMSSSPLSVSPPPFAYSSVDPSTAASSPPPLTDPNGDLDDEVSFSVYFKVPLS